jgi:hypothetical protein
MRTPILVFSLVLLSAPVACSGLVVDGGTQPTPASTATAPGSADSTASPPTSSTAAPAACSAAKSTATVTLDSQADVIARLGGVWRNCQTGTQPLGTVGGPAGFELQPDGHYYALGFGGSGELVRLTGFTNEGHLADVPGQGSPDIFYANGSFDPLEIQLSSDGTTLRIFNEAGTFGPYVASHETVAVLPTAPDGAHEGAAACGAAETDVFASATSVAGAIASVSGTWSLCPAADNRPLGPGTVGVEFDPGGTWAFLLAPAGGTPVPSTDPEGHGTYTFQLNGYSFDGTPHWQLNMQTANGTFVFEFATSQSPVKLWLTDEGGPLVFSAN